MKYYYLINNRIMWSYYKMPTKDSNDYRYTLESQLKVWKDELKPCEISESELDKVKKYLGNYYDTYFIDVTSIISDNNGVVTFKDKDVEINYDNAYSKANQFINNSDEKLRKIIKKLSSDEFETLRDRFADFYILQQPKQVEEIDAVEFSEWILKEDYAKYIDNNGKFLCGKFKETKDYTTKQLHEIFKNQK